MAVKLQDANVKIQKGSNNLAVKSGKLVSLLEGSNQIQQSQGKPVRACRSEIFDVSVDFRRSSPTFGKWIGVILSEQNRQQLWIPVGFAHGYYVLSEWAEIIYNTSDYCAP